MDEIMDANCTKNTMINTIPNSCIIESLMNYTKNFIIVFQDVHLLNMFVVNHDIEDVILICHKTENVDEENILEKFIYDKNMIKKINNLKILITAEGFLRFHKTLHELFDCVNMLVFNFIDDKIVSDKRFDNIKNKTDKVIVISGNTTDEKLEGVTYFNLDHNMLVERNILKKIKIFNFEPKSNENTEIFDLITKIIRRNSVKRVLMVLDNVNIDEMATKYKTIGDDSKAFTFSKKITGDSGIKTKVNFTIIGHDHIKELYFDAINICYITHGCTDIDKCIGYMSSNSNNIIISHKDNNIYDIVHTNFVNDKILTDIFDGLICIDKSKKNYETFNEKYAKLIKWIEKNEKIPSYYSKNSEEKRLGSWCAYTKREKRLGKVSDDIIKLLEKIEGWNWGKAKFSFEDRLAELKEWSDAHDNKIPSYISKKRKEKKLAIWCNTMRQAKKKNKLSQHKIDELEKIKNWFWVGDMKNFDDTLAQLKEWICKNHTLPSLTSKEPDEKYLAKWCSNKRNAKNKGTLSDEHIKKLEEIKEWKWGTTFNSMLQAYDKWTKENDKFPSQSSKNELEKKLAIWRNARCQEKKKGKLADDKINALSELSMWKW